MGTYQRKRAHTQLRSQETLGHNRFSSLGHFNVDRSWPLKKNSGTDARTELHLKIKTKNNEAQAGNEPSSLLPKSLQAKKEPPQVNELVSWCFEPSQPQRITSELNTNFTLSLSHSFHKSSYHKSCLLSLSNFRGQSHHKTIQATGDSTDGCTRFTLV